VSGLETAIRNALDRSDRGDAQARARIYQSARQALEAGLRRQGVGDALIIMQQQKRLEDKIGEIEKEEIDRLAQAAAEPVLPEDAVAVGPMSREPVEQPSAEEAFLLEGAMREADLAARGRQTPPQVELSPERPAQVASRPQPAIFHEASATQQASTRQDPAAVGPAVTPPAGSHGPQFDGPGSGGPDFGGPQFDGPRVSASDGLTERLEAPQVAALDPARGRKSRRGKVQEEDASDSAGRGRSARGRRGKGRKRRSFLSFILTWLITLAVVAAACWWFYTSGMVQSVLQDALQAADRAARGQGGGGSFDPRGGFSDDWAAVFSPADIKKLKVGGQASAQAVAGSDGPAIRLTSSTPDQAGDVVVEVPAEVLRQMAAKTSTIALTIQSGANQAVQLSVRCDFGSLGECPRHRFTATQERLEALFSVTFDRTLAPNAPGRLLLNVGIDGADKAVLLYSVRILPGH